MTFVNRVLRGLAPAILAAAALPFLAHAQIPSTRAPRPESCVGGIIEAVNAEAAAPAPKRIEPAVPNAATEIPLGADSALVESLQKGGYIIFLRHAPTNWSERDQIEGDFKDRSKQRNLTEAGQKLATNVGFAIKALEIPIERVLASPMWRCRETAELAFGAYDTTGLLFWKGGKYREARIKLLSTPPAQGKNLVLVGHQDQLLPIVPALKRDQLAEGDALVFEPLGNGKFRVVRQVTPVDWALLAGLDLAGFEIPKPGVMPAVQDSSDSKPGTNGAKKTSSKSSIER